MKSELFGLPIKIERWKYEGLLPLYIENSYDFSTASIANIRCTIAKPVSDLPALPALKKQLAKIREVGNAPVVLELGQLSSQRKQYLIKDNIAFVTSKQAFLPFIGAILSNEQETKVNHDRFYSSTQQLFLLYLYNNKKQFYVKDALKTLTFSTMTLSRAVKQLEASGLFNVCKDGVSNVIESRFDRLELFEKAQEFLSSPVRKCGYINKSEITANMVLAGESILAKQTMLNATEIETFAVYEKNFNKNLLGDELIDPSKQAKLELWAYEPAQFSQGTCADVLSVALSFKDVKDERIEQAVEKIVKTRLSE